MADFKYEIVENIGVLSTSPSGRQKELNLVSRNERDPKYDLRDRNADHSRMRKGVTLSEEEAKMLLEILKDEFK